MLNKQKITKIRNLRRDGSSIRKIAKRLKISKDTVAKYIKSMPSVKEILPALKIGVAEVTGDVTTSYEDIGWSQLSREEPLGSITVREMPSSDFPNAYIPVQDYSYNRDDRPPRRRVMRFDQPCMESNNYSEDLNLDGQYVRPRMPGIPVPRKKHGTLEKFIVQIKKEHNDQKQKQEIQSLSRKVDKMEREDCEFEKKINEIREIKLASDQNKKTESDNLNKISTTNQDNKIGSILHVKEPQKTEKLEEQKKFTNHESTYTDKNMPIHDSNNDKSTVLGTDMAPLLLAKIFEGSAPFIGSLIVHKLNKVKFNNIPPKKVKLIPLQNAKIIHPMKGHFREAKKEEEIKLIPLDE